MVEPISIVTESVISAFLQDALKRITEKLSKGRKLTEVETLTLLMNERFRSVDARFNGVEAEMRGLRDGQTALRDRFDAVENRFHVTEELAQLKAKVAQLEARG